MDMFLDKCKNLSYLFVIGEISVISGQQKK